MSSTKKEIDVDLSKGGDSQTSGDEIEEVETGLSMSKHDLPDRTGPHISSDETLSNQDVTSRTKKRRKQANPTRFSPKRKYKRDISEEDANSSMVPPSTESIPAVPGSSMGVSTSSPTAIVNGQSITNENSILKNETISMDNMNSNLSRTTNPVPGTATNTSFLSTTGGNVTGPVSPMKPGIENYFAPMSSSSNFTIVSANSLTSTSSLDMEQYTKKIKSLEAALEEEKHKTKAFEEKVNTLTYTIESYNEDIKTLSNELVKKENEIKDYQTQYSQEIVKWLSTYAHLNAKEKRKQCATQSAVIGKITLERIGHEYMEVWQDGSLFHEIKEKEAELAKRKEEIEQEKRALRKMLSKPQKSERENDSQSPPNFSNSNESMGNETMNNTDLEFEYLVRNEALKMRTTFLKKDQMELQEKIEKFLVDKSLHIRELKRIRDEDSSRFKIASILNERYLLIHLLGKGGFSEVWHSYDLMECMEVAVKIHQLNPSWTDERKSNYIKHAVREHDIQKRLRHKHVVALYDCFVIDDNGFATVLEYCPGPDLERYLKQYNTLKESEARSIIIQLLSALKYMNSQPTRIIHYDLKPANILFDLQGNAKISDFGLSKEFTEDSSSHGMELTSQGAGTYWYLPPECFKTDGSLPPLINTKVDVWSIGVILYQMLFGKKPFGDGVSQEKIIEKKIILNANVVDIPAKPQISPECKDFIIQCLNKDIKLRANVLDLCKHPFVTQYKERK